MEAKNAPRPEFTEAEWAEILGLIRSIGVVTRRSIANREIPSVTKITMPLDTLQLLAKFAIAAFEANAPVPVFTAEDYAFRNDLCPACRGAKIEATTLGILGGGPDTNRATCQVCGWKGVAHELLPAEITAHGNAT